MPKALPPFPAIEMKKLYLLLDQANVALGRVIDTANQAWPTVNKSLKQLGELGIVKEITGKSRNKIYVYHKYFDILSKGAAPIVSDYQVEHLTSFLLLQLKNL